MKVTITAKDNISTALGRMVDAKGHAVCEPPDALDGFLRDGHLDLALRSTTLADGEGFIRALAEYPLGGYVYAQVLE